MIFVASFIWCLAFIASNLLKCLLLSLHIIAVNMQCYPFLLHIQSSYHAVALHYSSARQHPASMSSEKRIFIHFSCGFDLTRQYIKKEEGKNKPGTDGGLPSKPASQVLSLAWQCDIFLHVAYGV